MKIENILPLKEEFVAKLELFDTIDNTKNSIRIYFGTMTA